MPVAYRYECIDVTIRVDVVLVMDASTSMREVSSSSLSKLEAAVQAAAGFIDLMRHGDQVSVVSFNESASTDQRLTSDFAAAQEALKRINVSEKTRIDLGIALAASELASSRRRAGNEPVMIVLTDGKANPVPVDVAVRQAAQAKEAGITVFTIGLGRAEDLEMDALREMASAPTGYYHAPRAERLAEIYGQVVRTVRCSRATGER